MKLKLYRKAALLLVSTGAAALVLAFGVTQQAQTGAELPARSGHINDFAQALDDPARQQLENTLENLQQKTGIQFDVVTVATTYGQDIFDYSLKLAQSWNVVGRGATGKKLLLVLAVKEQMSFTQFSRAAQAEMPEGLLGDIGHRLHAYLISDRAGAGVNYAVDYFVRAIARNRGISLEELKAPVATTTAIAVTNEPTPSAVTTPQPVPDTAVNTALPQATPEATVNSAPQATPEPTVNSVARQVSPEPASVVATPTPESSASFIRKPGPARTSNDDNDSEEVELTLTKPPQERIDLLKAFLEKHPDSNSKTRATELLVSSYAARGDELLKQGDSAGGVAELLLAISDAPTAVSDKLFAGVISQIPLNLYLRGERAAADKAARNIVAKFGSDPSRLLAVASFYITVERGEEAIQIATQATKLAPTLAEAHQKLGVALHISLRLEEAAAEYQRALELDPNSKAARRGLADLRRAAGKDEEALALYRQQLGVDPTDKAAHAGVVISLLDLGRVDEAKAEIESSLKTDPRNLPLLSSAAYWFAAHGENDLAITLGNQAVAIEPRYTWSHVAVARALIAQRNPLAAEGVLRFARQYGKFPTLDYELANALVAAGVYDEAAEVLTQTFRFNNDKIETRLGGRTTAQAANFIDLLTLERQASLFQLIAADSESSAKILKSLLVFATAINLPAETISEPAAVAAAKEFATGTDAARAYRELYAANKLLQKGIGLQTAYELAEAARSSADAALTVPAVSLAVQADEYRDIRARAIAAGGTAEIIPVPPNILSNILRGHIEDTSGWALFNLDKLDEAVDHLGRAVNILPSGTPALRAAQWHLGAALERQGKNEDAISYYIKSYNAGAPDPVRRAVIENLYRRVNGSLKGLDERIEGAGSAAVSETNTTPAGTNAPNSTATPEMQVTPATVPEETKATPNSATETAPKVSPSPETVAPTPSPSTEPTPSATPSPTPEVVAPAPAPSTEVKEPASPSPSPEATATPSPTPASETNPPVGPAPLTKPVDTPATFTVSGSVKDASDKALSNVVVLLISPQGTVLTTTTNDQGNYSFTVAASDRGYRLIPSRDGLIFEPVDKVLSAVSGDVKDLNFTGTPKQ